MDQKRIRPLIGTVLPALLCLGLVGLVGLRIHLRAQTTIIGYEIGRLKANEARLIEARNMLKMQLAKMTSQKHLSQIIQVSPPKGAAEGNYALK